MSECFDRQGRPIALHEFARLAENREEKIVARTELAEDVLVSTVWLGLNHQWNPDLPPLIFETLVFGGPLDGEMWRYSTEARAWEGHAYVVGLVRVALGV